MATSTKVTTTTSYVKIIDIAETSWSVQNVGGTPSELLFSTSQPASTVRGHVLLKGKFFTSSDFGTGNVYAKIGYGFNTNNPTFLVITK